MKIITTSLIFFLILLGMICFPATGAELSTSAPNGLHLAIEGEEKVTIILNNGDSGISGYNLTVKIQDLSIASITSISYPDWVMLPVTSDINQDEIFVKGIDLGQAIQPGHDPTPLFTLNLTGNTKGSTIITVIPQMVDDDRGGRYSLASVQIPVHVGSASQVQTPSPPASSMMATSQAEDKPEVDEILSTYPPSTHLEITGIKEQSSDDEIGYEVVPATPINGETSPVPTTSLSLMVPILGFGGLYGIRRWRINRSNKESKEVEL